MSYRKHLSQDKKLVAVIKEHPDLSPGRRKNICLSLCRAVMSQQLSTKVASTLYDRFINKLGTKNPSPSDILLLNREELRQLGLSYQKADYLRNIAGFFVQNPKAEKQLAKMTDEEVIQFLTQIKGVGKWTVEMQLMFSLGREDVFPVEDYGIQVSMAKLYKIPAELKPSERKAKMSAIAAKWSPYRTFASLHLWMWKDA